MTRKRVIATVFFVFVVVAIAGGIWWYYEENIKITLPVDEKTAIRIGRAAIEEAFPERTSGEILNTYRIEYFAQDEGDTWTVIWNLQLKSNPDSISIGNLIKATIDKESGTVLEVRLLEEG